MRQSKTLSYDVVVIGSGPGGFPAALAAARGGAKTLLVERNQFLGGAATSGLGNLGFIDRQNQPALGGIPLEFMQRLEAVGGAVGSYSCPVHNSISPVSPDLVKVVLSQMCAEAEVDVLYSTDLSDVQVINQKLCAIELRSKTYNFHVTADIFIDGTGDGELAFLAGCRFTLGDEREMMQPGTLMFSITGFDLERFFQYLDENPDDYGIKEPYAEGYNVDFFRRTKGHCFIGLQHLIEKARANGDFDVPRNQFIYITTPSDKLLAINTSRITMFDATNPFTFSKALDEGYRQVLQIRDFLRRYAPGFEHADISQISPTLGVRESRHFSGVHKLVFDQIYADEIERQSIGRCAYNVDIHSADTEIIDLALIERSFGIPYGCMVPPHLDGLLLSGRTIDVDSKVFAAIRVMGPCMAIGQAAGAAAAMCAKTKTAPVKLSIDELRQTLRAQDVIL